MNLYGAKRTAYIEGRFRPQVDQKRVPYVCPRHHVAGNSPAEASLIETAKTTLLGHFLMVWCVFELGLQEGW